MGLADDVRDLQQMTGSIPARWAPPPNAAPPAAKLYVTTNDPGGNYPQADTGGGGYYGKRCNVPHGNQIDSVGPQGFSPPQSNTGNYIFNLGMSFIPPSTLIPVWQVGQSFFTQYTVNALYVGTATDDITLTHATQFPTPIISVQFQQDLTKNVAVQNIYSLSIPKGGICQVQQNYNGLVLIGPPPSPILAAINSDIAPNATGLATPQMWGGAGFSTNTAIGQVTVTDTTGVGARSGASAFILYVGKWLMMNSTPCTPPTS